MNSFDGLPYDFLRWYDYIFYRKVATVADICYCIVITERDNKILFICFFVTIDLLIKDYHRMWFSMSSKEMINQYDRFTSEFCSMDT